jgi:hypothetical protein
MVCLTLSTTWEKVLTKVAERCPLHPSPQWCYGINSGLARWKNNQEHSNNDLPLTLLTYLGSDFKPFPPKDTKLTIIIINRLQTLLLLNWYIFNQIPRYLNTKFPQTTNNPTSTTRESSKSTAAVSHQPEMTSPQCRRPGRWVVRSATCPAPPHWGNLTLTLRNKPRLPRSSAVSPGKGERNPTYIHSPWEIHFSATDRPHLWSKRPMAKQKVWSISPPNHPHVQVHPNLHCLIPLLRSHRHKMPAFCQEHWLHRRKETSKNVCLCSRQTITNGKFVDGIFSSEKLKTSHYHRENTAAG